jgi:hypothetical protein
MKITLPSDILIGQYLQFFTLIVAASIAFVYTCGYTFGLFVHSLNDTVTSYCTTARHPKPPNLKEQALEAATRFYAKGHDDCTDAEVLDDYNIILHALEQLHG